MSYDFIIGAGHTPSGTNGSGAVGKIDESNCTREIAPKIVNLLNSNGKTASYSVVNDGNPAGCSGFPDCRTRINNANADGCGMYVEIHLNASGGTGIEVDLPTNASSSTRGTATNICAKVAEAFGYNNRGLVVRDDLTIFKYAQVPVILIECGFVDSSDADIYNADKYANAIASVLSGTDISGGSGGTNTDSNEPKWKEGWNQDAKGWFYVTDVANKKYYSSSDGWKYIKDAWYIFNDAGYARKDEWYKGSDNFWYFLDDNCKMIFSTWLLEEDKDTWYYMNEKGQMLTSKWFKYKDNWYYLKDTGKMAAKEWFQDNSKWYYFNEEGDMAVNKFIVSNKDQYYLGSDGVMVVSTTIEIEDKKCTFNEKGMLTKQEDVEKINI